MSKQPTFRVGQYVTRQALPGVGPITGRIRSVVWCEDADWDQDAEDPEGAYIINLEDGNYGGEALFTLASGK